MDIPHRDTAAVLFLDLQSEIVKNSRTLEKKELERGAGALAKLVALHVVDRIRKLAESVGAAWTLEELPRHRRRALEPIDLEIARIRT